VRHPSGYKDIMTGGVPHLDTPTSIAPGKKKMSTNQPSRAPGASAAAEAVEAHVTAPPIPNTSDVAAQRETAEERGRHGTGERP